MSTEKAQDSKPSTEDLNNALRSVMNLKSVENQPENAAEREPENAAAPEPEPEASTEAAETAASEPAENAAAQAESESEDSPDLVALREELASTRKRAAESLDWARSGFLKKSNEAQQYRQLLERMAGGAEVERDELNRLLAGGQIPSTPQQVIQQPQVTDDAMAQLDTQQFLFDKGLNEKQAQEFETWLRSPEGMLTPREIVPGNTYATLALAHSRYSASRRPDPVIVEAAKTVSRVQRATARAAAAPAGRQSPTPTPQPPDPMKMTPQERMEKGIVDKWFSELARDWTR